MTAPLSSSPQALLNDPNPPIVASNPHDDPQDASELASAAAALQITDTPSTNPSVPVIPPNENTQAPPTSTPAQHTEPVVPLPNPAQPPVPPWLSDAREVLLGRYPVDRFEVVARTLLPNPAPEWRVKCLDCPGKLYTPGPGETLSNFEVHLKNRDHRRRVNERVVGSGG